jgi:hypothetical protein
MGVDSALQPLWDWCLRHLGVTGVASPAFLLTAVVAGVYVPDLAGPEPAGRVFDSPRARYAGVSLH